MNDEIKAIIFACILNGFIWLGTCGAIAVACAVTKSAVPLWGLLVPMASAYTVKYKTKEK